jgi:exodeoxyribonuclease V alpha subunit
MSTGDQSADSGASIEGTLERVVFQNPENNWTVAKFAPEAGGEAVTIVGPLLGVTIGASLRVRGKWVVDKRYGEQFKIDSYQTKSPETLLGIERYLGSGLVPGIGPELAKRVVKHFGLDTMTIIEATPHRLAEVEGIGATRVAKIGTAWKSQKDIQDVMVFLRGHGVSSAYAVRIFKRYGQDAINIVRENPYRLALDIWGIGFKSADAIAQNLGIAKTAPERIEAGLVHVLGTCGDDGHCHVPELTLINRTAELLEVDSGLLDDPLERLLESELVVKEVLGDRGHCVSLTAMWHAESEAATAFADLAATPMRPLKIDLEKSLSTLEEDLSIELAPHQRNAIEAAAVDKVVVITGGPGVGKTTIVRGIVSLFFSNHRRIGLAAPTGRAAKRLSESTGMEAITLHRLLEFQPQLGGFNRNADNKLDVDVVIVDEVSMVDIDLFRALVIAMRSSAQLILVGDIDQLPSVGPGSVLADVIASKAATVCRLTEVFRQAASSRIITNAHKVNEGVMPDLAAPPGREASRSDFYFIERDDPISARETIVDMVAERIPSRFGLDPFRDVQVLCPMHRGELGTLALNTAMQNRLNAGATGVLEIKRGDRAFRAGDKVMQIRNDYDKSVFNGDIGIINDIVGDGQTKLVVDFVGGRTAIYERPELDQLVHAYAVSIHKSQGSEYPAIVMPIATQHYMMLQRNLLYTGITRGKQLVVVIGSRRAVNMAVRNNQTRTRWTYLAQRIQQSAQ